MAKKHDPFASLEGPPPKKRSFLSSLLGKDKPASTASSKKTAAASSSSSKVATTNAEDTAIDSSADASDVQYKSPFREESTTKKEKPSDSLQDTYTPPDLQKKSKTPKNFTSGTKLTQELPKSSRRFSWRNLFKFSSGSAKPKTDTVKEETGVDATVKSSTSIASKEVAKAKAVAETEKQLVSNDLTEEQNKELNNVERKASADNSIDVSKTEPKTAVASENDTLDPKLEINDANRETPVVNGVILGEKPSFVADEKDDKPEIIDLDEDKQPKSATDSVAEEKLDVAKNQPEVTKEVQSEPVHVAAVVPKSSGASSIKEKENRDDAKLKLNGNHQDVDVGAGLQVKQDELLKVAKDKVEPVLMTLDDNAKKQQQTDEDYKEYKKQERQLKHENKLQKLKEKNENKYTKKETKYNTKIQELKDKIASLEGKISSAKEQHKKDLEETKAKHEQSLKEEEEKFKNDKETLIKEHELLKEKKEKELEELISNQKKSKMSIKLLESKKSEFETKSKLLGVEIEELESNITEKKAALKDLTEAHEEHKAKIAKLTKTHDETTNKLAKEAAKQAKLDSKGESQLGEINAIHDSIKLYETQLATLKKESADRSETYKALKKNLEDQKKFDALLEESKLKKDEEMESFLPKQKTVKPVATDEPETRSIPDITDSPTTKAAIFVGGDSISPPTEAKQPVETLMADQPTKTPAIKPAEAVNANTTGATAKAVEKPVEAPKEAITEPEPVIATQEQPLEDALNEAGAEIPFAAENTQSTSGGVLAKVADAANSAATAASTAAASTVAAITPTKAEPELEPKVDSTNLTGKTELVTESTAGGVGKVTEKLVDAPVSSRAIADDAPTSASPTAETSSPVKQAEVTEVDNTDDAGNVGNTPNVSDTEAQSAPLNTNKNKKKNKKKKKKGKK